MVKNNFDLLRLVAALFVVFTHCYELSAHIDKEPLYHLSNGLIRLSTIGLYIFYFISGFLVIKSFKRTGSLYRFMLKRARRIYPGLIVVTLVTVFIVGPLFTSLSPIEYFKNLSTWKYLVTVSGFFIQYQLPGVFTDPLHFDHGVNGSLWSVALELRLYLALIIVGWFSIRFGKKFSFIPLILCSIFCCLINYDAFHLGALVDNLHARLVLTFFVGITTAFYQDKIPVKWSLLLAFTPFYLLTFFIFQGARIIIEPLFFSYLTLCFALSTKPQKLPIDISYGIYIYSFLTTQCIIQIFRMQNPFQIILVVSIFTLPISFLSALYIENRPFTLHQKPALPV